LKSNKKSKIKTQNKNMMDKIKELREITGLG
jgi:hypothetical protein